MSSALYKCQKESAYWYVLVSWLWYDPLGKTVPSRLAFPQELGLNEGSISNCYTCPDPLNQSLPFAAFIPRVVALGFLFWFTVIFFEKALNHFYTGIPFLLFALFLYSFSTWPLVEFDTERDIFMGSGVSLSCVAFKDAQAGFWCFLKNGLLLSRTCWFFSGSSSCWDSDG